MNSSQVRTLSIIVAVLLVALLALDLGDGNNSADREYLLPTVRQFANDIDTLSIRQGASDTLEIEKVDGAWLVSSRDNFHADSSKVRALLVAMSEAQIVEAKTANPEMHGRLGVDLPGDDSSKGTQVTASGAGQSVSVIFGNVALGDYRYARVADEDQSWLVDQNPEIPQDVGDWLNADIIDISSDRVRQVRIQHPDGEVVAIGKLNEGDEGFEVYDIPDGRELSYATVANGIAGGLASLRMEDVRRAPEMLSEDAVSFTVETFDGLTVTAQSTLEDAASWVTFAVAPADSEEGIALAARLDGWQFKLPDYKANMLKRRFEDILKALPDEE